MSEFVKELDRATFDAETSKGLVVIDFWAPWCAPCRMMAPIFAGVAEKLQDKAIFAKVNIEAVPDIHTRFGISSVPTFLVLKDGVEVDMHHGTIRPDELIFLVNKNV